ncbi:unnamed protein product [Diamesa serratosioi]
MFSKWLVILLLTSMVMSELSSKDEMKQSRQVVRGKEHARHKRAALKPLGFFGKIAFMGGLLFQQYNDTSNSLGRIRDILYDNFSDTATKKPPSASDVTTSEPGETTTEKYRISRAEFGKILNKNLRGIRKLMRIELADAKNQSRFSIAEYKQEYYNQVKPPGKIINNSINLTTSNTV